jgi:dGTPase
MKARGRERTSRWSALLADTRLYGKSYPADEDRRSEFQRDYDRIIFSSAFRRLQDKTQVFPLSTTDYTRTRLTHSLECSSVARSLGILAAKHLQAFGVACEPHDVGTIVATAALAHDLGNPPFGHSGEAAIQSWAKQRLPSDTLTPTPLSLKRTLSLRRTDARSVPMTATELADFQQFEGNAQGLRMLLRTMARTRKGGLRPTLATIGAMTKYPRPSLVPGHSFESTVSQKKPGYFQDDRMMALKAFRTLGLTETAPGVFSRHPLAFLTEAADDICYSIADLEDGFKLGIVSFNAIRDVLLPLAEKDRAFHEIPYSDQMARVLRLRASAFQVLVGGCAKAFRESLDELEAGRLSVPLIDRTPYAEQHRYLKILARENVYRHDRVLQVEYAGYHTIGGLLNMFYDALCASSDESRDDKLRRLLPSEFLRRPGKSRRPTEPGADPVTFYLSLMTPYERLLAVTDYVSGMTDRFAVNLYQRLSGIRLPD